MSALNKLAFPPPVAEAGHRAAETRRQLFVDTAFILRTMLFSFPVHVLALTSVGIPIKNIVALEGLFLLGSSTSQLFGALLNDAVSPKVAFALGKLLCAVACLGIAFFHSPAMLTIFFFIWGAGTGIYDGSDFLSEKKSEHTWISHVKVIEKLGFYGSLISFVLGGVIFSHFGFKALFTCNALVAAAIPVLLQLSGISRKNVPATKIQRQPFDFKIWLAGIPRAPWLLMLAYTFVTVALKLGMIEVQRALLALGVTAQSSGWLFVGFTLLAMLLMRLSPRQMGLGIFVTAVLTLSLGLLPAIQVLALSLSVSLMLFIRVASRILFFSRVVEASTPFTAGRNTSAAQVVAGLVLYGGSAHFAKFSMTGVGVLGILAMICFIFNGQFRSIECKT